MGRVIGCQLSKFPNSCVASSLLQEELSFFVLGQREIANQMTSFLYMSDSGSLEESKLTSPSSVPSRLLMAAFDPGVAAAFSCVLHRHWQP